MSTFTKKDLENGDVVVTRDRTYMMFLKNYAGYSEVFTGIFEDEYMESEATLSNLHNRNNISSCDIVKVYRAFNPWVFPVSKKQIEEDYEVMFEEFKEISMEEAENRLSELEGRKVKIV